MSVVNIGFTWVTCCYDGCDVSWGMTDAHNSQLRQSHAWFYCPNGHRQHYTGKSDEQKLRDAEARETHLKDQLEAAGREAEAARVALLRDRQRFARGVCPCCNRYFPQVHRHMTTQHPGYDLAKVEQAARATKFVCSCGSRFETFRGLRTHQGHMRGNDWAKPETPKTHTWGGAHLTVV